jgi:hypothetical protein
MAKDEKVNITVTKFVVLILTLESSLMPIFWTFNFSLDILATILATFQKVGQFFSILWSLCLGQYSRQFIHFSS